MMRLADLVRKNAQHPQRIIVISGDEDRKPPHDGQRSECALERVGMNVGHLLGRWPLQQDHGPIRRSSERGRLRKQPTIGERYGKVRVSLALDQNRVADEIVPDNEALDAHVERVTPPRESQ